MRRFFAGVWGAFFKKKSAPQVNNFHNTILEKGAGGTFFDKLSRIAYAILLMASFSKSKILLFYTAGFRCVEKRATGTFFEDYVEKIFHLWGAFFLEKSAPHPCKTWYYCASNST